MEGTTNDKQKICKTEEDSPASVEEDEDNQRTISWRRIAALPVLVVVYEESNQAEFSSADSGDEEEEQWVISGHC